MSISVFTTDLPRVAAQDAPGPKSSAPAIPGGGGGAAAEAADIVALSEDALLRLGQGAPGSVARQLGRTVDPSGGLSSPSAGAALPMQAEPSEKAARLIRPGTAARRALTVPGNAHAPDKPEQAVSDPAPLAAVLLRAGGKTLALLQRQPGDAHAQDPAGTGGIAAAHPAGLATAMPGEAQLALALPQAARRALGIAAPRRAQRRHPDPIAAASGQHGPDRLREQMRLTRRGLAAILLVLAVAGLWVATTLDLTLARTVCAAVAGALILVKPWRRPPSIR